MALASVVAAKPSRLELHRFSPSMWYVLASIGFLGLWIGFYIFDPFGFDQAGRDSWHHAAVLRELMAHPFSPSNPHLPTNEPSRYFTPIALLAALVGKLFGLSPYQLFGYMGAATCIGLVTGCWLFARRYYGSVWAPLILLLTLLFAWGAQISHAGLHNYATMLSSAAYPATIALVLGLFSWSIALDALEANEDRPFALVMLGLLTAVIFLEHQLSAVIVFAGTGSMILFQDRATYRTKAALLIALALGCLLTLAWPYFNIVEVLSSASDPRWKSAVGGMNHVSTAMTLAAPVFLGVAGFRRPQGGLRWELVFPAALFAVAYVVLTISDSAIAHRLPAAIILFNQLGLVWLVLGYGDRVSRGPKRLLTLAVVVLIVVSSAVASVARLHDLRTRAAEGSMIEMAEAMAATMPPGSIAFATNSVVFPLQATGMRVVSIPRPEPAAPSLTVRQLATDRLFSINADNDERRELIDRWGATHIVFVPSDLRPGVVDQLRKLGPSKTFSHGAEVISIDRTKAVGLHEGEAR